MSIERAVHERWQTYRPLIDAVPIARVQTGWQSQTLAGEEVGLPYVVLARSEEAEVKTPSGGIRLVSVPLEVRMHTATLSEAKTIRTLVQDRYDDAAFRYAEGQVLLMRRTGVTEERLDDGTWRIVVHYDTITQES